MKLWLHPLTQHQLNNLKANLPQSLLLSGVRGVGLRTVAASIANKDLAATIQPENAKGEVDDMGTISVETIRKLYNQTRTKQAGRRIIIIDDCERMSKAAQSAFLKLLEEPNTVTHFILTSHEPSILLPTVRSRLQQLIIQPLTPQQAEKLIASQHINDERKRTQLQFIAPGLPAEVLRLTSNPTHLEAKIKIITDARAFLQADAYMKLKLINNYRSNREDAVRLLEGAMAIIKHSLTLKPQPNLIIQLDKLLAAKERVASNQNIPLTLTSIVL